MWTDATLRERPAECEKAKVAVNLFYVVPKYYCQRCSSLLLVIMKILKKRKQHCYPKETYVVCWYSWIQWVRTLPGRTSAIVCG